MKQKRWMLFVVPIVVVLVGMACGFNVSTAKINDASMARDSEGADKTTSFSPNDTFYCNVDLASAPDDTSIKAVWTAVEVEGTEPNLKIDESELKSGSGVVNFKLENANAWPAGKYKVDIYLNDKLDRTLDFAVQ